MSDLRTALAKPGPVALGSGTFDLHGTVSLKSRVVHGDGAVIHWTPDDTRNSPAFILKGTAPEVSGVTIVGPTPDGAPYDASKEGQHAFQIDGAVEARILNCSIKNVYGDGIYIGTVGQLAHESWTTDLYVQEVRFDEIGRHAITANALDGGLITGLNIQRVNLAIFDIEPPGHAWGCKHLTWSDSIIRDWGGGFVLANKGVGKSDSVQDIVLDGIMCLRRIFNVQVNPPEGTRRQRFTIKNCGGTGEAMSPPLNFRHVDGVTVTNVDQPVGHGVPLVRDIDCTNVVVT